VRFSLDDGLRDLVALLFEFLDDERALNELVESVHFRFADLIDQILAGEVAAELLRDGLHETADLTVGDDLVIDDGRDAIDDLRGRRPTGDRQHRDRQ
jgi:hypothetical protein